MMSKIFFVAAFLFINGCVADPALFLDTNCKINDNECADRIFTKATEVVIAGAESLYIDSVDPLEFDVVEGNLTIIDYKLENSTITGFKSCKLVSVKTNWASSKLNLQLECPADAKIVGKFDIKGRIFSGPIAGTGDYEFTLGTFKVNLAARFSKKIRSDRNIRLVIKNFVSRAQVKTPTKAVFTNLKTEDLSKFTPLTWKAVGDVLQEPILFASMKKILNNLNLYLRSVTFETEIAASNDFISPFCNTLPTCGPNDIACMEKKANAVYQIIMKGDPERNIEPHEPLFQDYIEGNLSVLEYKYYNSTYTGMDTCKISNLSWDAKSSTMSFDYECAPIKIDGKYEITGRLIVLPIEGKGDYQIQTNGYKLRVDCGMSIVEKADGTKHWHINTYKLDATATGPLVFSYTNLFNGQKDLSDTLHKFANANWKEVAEIVEDPVWYAHAKKIIAAANKYLKYDNI
ncbi:uncharacterized protein LOC121733914 [Aricia agestis]|uniref:uncharacterized protein LOC121733914 n=1 Tax=Aricia agestis TaxID=91739 RepID=UPI001C203A96|nr:uncharacterized protein LOC121733914 [Aricia agestis]